ncbi:molybdate ABC transporter substrate-binding protein [Agromyces aerolatus]|uniref:molybdate ABC transporter substrate-binding protein n=1 Tax=Agromyces sp. LY-1074 TaxID=3074080 RepID=UPI002860BDD4|nr:MULTISPECIES: molybdate ABC transporter substrate-binding protein [unclassified Agromyces]MDR5698201.1 molybdate ABC transporter substrate-binding protein [Agromyces sp. LY-1074]MDR5704495.1 molybdate ABC transporter substrate-binding protein [Agromyces sp. LY-1358]
MNQPAPSTASAGAPPARRRRLGRVAGLGAIAALALAGCTAGGGADGDGDAGPEESAVPTTTLTVYAAASLTDAFEALATQFESVYPAIDVAPIVADSSTVLATQIIEGAPADVFATADEVSMTSVDGEGMLAAAPQVFAQNAAVLAVPAGDPAGVVDLAGIARPEIRFIACVPDAPCGRAAGELLTAAGLQVTPVSEEQNVTAVLTKLELGEADAGVVYRSDVVRAGGAVQEIDTSAVPAVVNRYPIAPVGTAADPEVADAFVRYVLGAEGQAVLAEFGFSAP